MKSDGDDEDSLDEYMLKNHKWTYIEEPSREELSIAETERKYNLLGYNCNLCKITNKDLLMCSAAQVAKK